MADSDEHRLLQTMRQTELKDPASREDFCRRLIDALNMGETNYLILLAADTYDVPHKSRDDEFQADAGDTVYRYFVCAVCPVKAPTLELRYDHDLNEFHPGSTGHIALAPELGCENQCNSTDLFCKVIIFKWNFQNTEMCIRDRSVSVPSKQSEPLGTLIFFSILFSARKLRFR